MPNLNVTPEPVTPTATTTPGSTPPTLEQLAQQVAALQTQLQSLASSFATSQRSIADTSQLATQLQTQVQQLNTSLAALNQSFTVLDVEYKLHTHVAAPGQTVIEGDKGVLYTVPVTHVDDALNAFGVGGPPNFNPIMTGPPAAH
jgi:prefoldin subunit 5